MTDPHQATTNAPADAPHILVAEDSGIQAEMLRRLLAGAGYEVTIAPDGVDALAQIQARRPALLLSDVRMPRMGGIELCGHIKHDPSLQDLQVILITTLAEPKDIIEGAVAGADDYVIKPYRKDHLLQKVKEVLSHRELVRAQEEKVSAQLMVDGRPFDFEVAPTQLLKLLVSTYENATQQNRELLDAQLELQRLNRILEARLDDLVHSKLALGASEQRFRSIISLVPDIIYRVDPQGCFTYINEAVSELGWTPDELIGQHFSVLLDPEDADRVRRDVVLERLRGQASGDAAAPKLFDERRVGERATRHLEVHLAKRTGGDPESKASLLVGEVNSSGFYNEGPTGATFEGTVGAVRDISAHKQAEAEIRELNQALETRVEARTRELFLSNQDLEKALQELNFAQVQMIQTEKMVALGTLIAGVAHELNNPLMGAMNYIEHVSAHTQDVKLAGYLEKARRELERASGVIRNMLTFSRVSDESAEQVDVGPVIDDTLQLVAADYRHRQIEVTVDLPAQMPRVMARTGGLQQVLLNLLTNARDALENEKTGALHIGAEILDGMLRVSLRDNGPGIAPDLRQRIFDPFFTTKPTGKGTGLGLAVSASMVHGFGGRLTCESGAEGGACFHVDLPIASPVDVAEPDTG